MLRYEFWITVIAIAFTGACASPPPRIAPCTAANSPGSICGLMNPEDISRLPNRDWIVVSQMSQLDPEAGLGAPPVKPGNLLAIRAEDGVRRSIFPGVVGWRLETKAALSPTEGWGDPDCPGPPSEERFGPHGIDVGRHPSGVPMLGVVNHGEREAIELFEIDEDFEPSLSWRGCVEVPDHMSANDLALLRDGGFVVTKMIPRIESVGVGAVWTMLKIAAGWNTGAVYRWRPGREFELIPGSEGSAPNGVAVSPDESEIYVAQWGEANVYRVSLSGNGRVPDKPRMAELEHHPDNLTWTEDGRLIAAGQAGSVGDILGCSEIESGGCGLDYGVYSIDPESFEVEPLFTGKGAASVAIEVDSDVLVGVFVGDQIERVSRPR